MKKLLLAALALTATPALAQGLPPTASPGVPGKQQERLTALPAGDQTPTFTIGAPTGKVPTEMGVAVPILPRKDEGGGAPPALPSPK